LYEQVLNKIDGVEDRSLEAAITNNKALIYDDQGFWERAKDEYARSLSIYDSTFGKTITAACLSSPAPENTAKCASAATVLDNLGQVYTSLGQFERGLEELGSALTIWTALGDKVGEGTTTLHIGYAKFLMGRPREALVDYESARKLQEEASNAAGIALINTYLGLAHASLNEPQIALTYYNAALPIQRTAGDKRALALTLDNLGMAQQLTGHAKDGLANFSDALALWRTIKDPDGEALTLYHRAIAQAGTDDLVAANQSSEEAIRLVESLRTRLRAERSRTAYLADKQDYYKLDIDLKMRLSKLGHRDDYVSAAFESNEKGRARVLLESLAEADVVRSIRGKTSPQLERLRDERDSLQKRLAAKAMARTTFLSKQQADQQIASIDNDIARLDERYDEVEQAIKSEDPRFATLVRPHPASLVQIQLQLDRDTLLLEYSLGDSRSYVWVVTPGSIESVELSPRKEIEAAANTLMTALTERNRSIKNETAQHWQRRIAQADIDHDQAAAALSEMVLKPVAAMLDNKRLVIVADGALQPISFASLPVPVTDARPTALISGIGNSANRATPNLPRMLLDDHEVVYEPSASVLALQRRELENRTPAPNALAVLANPVFEKDDPRVTQVMARKNRGRDGAATTPEKSTETASSTSTLTRALDDIGLTRLPALPNSKIEASSIVKAAGTRPVKTIMDFDANRTIAISPELAKYRTVHFATHAVADFAHPELSGIVLSMVDEKGQPQDGYLRLHDIYNLNLPADLVVLSACQTGVGKEIKGEGLIALTRGFMYAGAQRVVASLWKVDDAATAELMGEFYDQMFSRKLSPAAALRAAQIKLSHQSGRHEPYYWAGFVLQGEWR
jgi:CHAT domain-containing protein/tetratricopeptide (TPR) repeat protein